LQHSTLLNDITGGARFDFWHEWAARRAYLIWTQGGFSFNYSTLWAVAIYGLCIALGNTGCSPATT